MSPYACVIASLCYCLETDCDPVSDCSVKRMHCGVQPLNQLSPAKESRLIA